MDKKIRVLVVCLGNICRSPMGEAVLRQVASQRGVEIIVDSAGTSAYHEGELPDERSVEICLKHNIPVNHRARRIRSTDFTTFTYTLASDFSNLEELNRLKPKGATTRIALWGAYDDNKPISDPYYGGPEGFELCYQQCIRYSEAFLNGIGKDL